MAAFGQALVPHSNRGEINVCGYPDEEDKQKPDNNGKWEDARSLDTLRNHLPLFLGRNSYHGRELSRVEWVPFLEDFQSWAAYGVRGQFAAADDAYLTRVLPGNAITGY